jgi:hypothetical protein
LETLQAVIALSQSWRTRGIAARKRLAGAEGHAFANALVIFGTLDPPATCAVRVDVRHLEANIRLQPELYLWSHRRWKHEWKAGYAPLWVGADALPKA